ncbi:hypothetical protein ACH4PU_32750 [Streptomyces sp. NPDC021100]|uniref:hypothetical protein n=1 Tax=Streptomyces sp. NPDC021100 TaxID=3365114 RepID=UPI0037ADD87A
MISEQVLEAMAAIVPECELMSANCEGGAYAYDTHPTSAALGEEGPRVWFCSPCGWEAAREA